MLREVQAILLGGHQEYENSLLWVAMCFGFYGFMRSGEFVLKAGEPFDPEHHITIQDVTVDSHSNSTVVRILIKKSKTDQFGKGALIYLSRTETDLCPVTALLAYLAQRPNIAHTPLFIERDGVALTKVAMMAMLHKALCSVGIDPITKVIIFV